MITSDEQVDAPVATVWDVTVDIEGLPATTPTITQAERLDGGPLRVGSRARLRQPHMRPAVWTVTRLEPQELFEWSTRVGWLTMTGRHRLRPVATGTANHLEVELVGFGAGVATRLLGGSIRRAITTENRGVKVAAERRASGHGPVEDRPEGPGTTDAPG
jgi:uncharacterized membrane protein